MWQQNTPVNSSYNAFFGHLKKRKNLYGQKHEEEKKEDLVAFLKVTVLHTNACTKLNYQLIIASQKLFSLNWPHWANSVIELPCPDVCLCVYAIGCSFFPQLLSFFLLSTKFVQQSTGLIKPLFECMVLHNASARVRPNFFL